MFSKPVFLVFLIVMALPIATRAGNWAYGSATAPAGSRNFALWVPAGYDKQKATPLVMMLHGCMQNPEDLAAISGMNAVAEKQNFLVVYPEQIADANPLKCWNWFDPKNQIRGTGEPSLLAAIVEKVQSSHNVNVKKVYVVGISAGGAMAVVMAATYPDLFSGVGASAGLAFKSATSVESGLAAMKQGNPNPQQLGLLAYTAMNDGLRVRRKKLLPLIVFQGSADPYVNPLNADQLITQWAGANDYLDDGKDNQRVKAQPVETIEGNIPGGYSYARSIYHDRAGRLVMEKWIVKGLAHAWSGSPTAGPFADPKGPNASEEMWRFFSETTERGRKPKVTKRKGAE
ncbi:MAG TPA: esterase [Blastocatellia bacterium]|nr:esterase [Blastocatellia bacterium]